MISPKEFSFEELMFFLNLESAEKATQVTFLLYSMCFSPILLSNTRATPKGAHKAMWCWKSNSEPCACQTGMPVLCTMS